MVLALSAAYVRFSGWRWMQGVFYRIGAAVIGIITRSAFKLTKLTLGQDKLLWGIFAILAVSTAWTSHEIIWLFLLGA
jgi:chromate transporter